MQKTYLLFLPILFIITLSLKAQTSGKLLIVVDEASTLVLDGDSKGELSPNKPQVFEMDAGEHFIQINSPSLDEEIAEIIEINSGKQKVLKLALKEDSPDETPKPIDNSNLIPIEEKTLTIDGAIVAGSWLAANPGNEYPKYPHFYYAFEKGDEIVLDLIMKNKKGTNIVEVATYPEGVVKYSKEGFHSLENVRIKVQERSIFRISLATNAALDRTMHFKIGRIPGSPASSTFNPIVKWENKTDTTWQIQNETSFTYSAQTVQNPQHFYINGGRNATFLGGASRITIPVVLPKNTVNWYYTFSAYRDKESINQVTQQFSLLGDITSALDQTGVINFGLQLLSQPPGGDICDIFILDQANSTRFTDKVEYQYWPEGSRENLRSGTIKVQERHHQSGRWTIGIKNPSSGHGIHVAIEVVAIVAEGQEQIVRKPAKLVAVRVPTIQE